ncbi:hypothetical protein BN1050_01287 [Metalysinibacillus saudimassiliensis]|uniref:Regulatory protein YlbF n=1 Tax=Metalysinibacillus saudimassiliensis TaxID=1461583 RepID=A0A078MAS9_9BACL|nr:hypothetical protein BN1050_01287 [Metalysinibacillus saudimassiliensis]
MMMTSEWAFILDEVDELNAMIDASQLAKNLREARDAVYKDEQLVAQIRAFQYMKEQYEDVQRFGKYHPDYSKVMKEIRQQKRALDLHDLVANLRLAENDFQALLDEIGLLIGMSVSPSVKVETDSLLTSSCGTGCGTGGGCACSA